MTLNPRKFFKRGFLLAEAGMTKFVGRELNPMFYLGAIGIYFLWVCFISGIYVYIFFDTSIPGAFESVERITHEQAWFGGVMRSFHRYTSDGLMLVMVLHMLREWALGRLKLERWFSWVSGMPVFWLVLISGITGYWLVWDQLAQYISVITAEWLDALPLAGSSIARNFLTPESLTGRFFTLLIFVHIFAPLFLIFMLWIHLQRISKPKINPPWVMTGGASLALLVLSVAWPAYSHPIADLSTTPGILNLDWYYLGLYPFFDKLSGGTVWAITGAGTVLLILLPFLPPGKKEKPARVFLDHCNGCRRCLEDCPYNAITMAERSDDKPFAEEATVNSSLCVSCGICVGSCPSSTPFRRTEDLVTGIDLPGLALKELRIKTQKAAKPLKGNDRLLVFGCERNLGFGKENFGNTGIVKMPCLGMLPPSFIDYALARNQADGVVLLGCQGGDCYHRLGIQWTDERVDQKRDPYLRKRVDRSRVLKLFEANSKAALEKKMKSFQKTLKKGDKR